MLKITPKLKADRFGSLCATDITYVAFSMGWACLSLATDLASHMIICYSLHAYLYKEGPIAALRQAISSY